MGDKEAMIDRVAVALGISRPEGIAIAESEVESIANVLGYLVACVFAQKSIVEFDSWTVHVRSHIPKIGAQAEVRDITVQ